MIIQFSCENFMSIKEKVTLSMVATKDTLHEDVLFEHNSKIKLVPCVSLYGANGAGKTNVLHALSHLRFLVKNSINFQEGDSLPFYPHKLNTSSLPSSFEIQFIAENKRYAYGFSLNHEQIVQEYLYCFPRGKQAKVFERENEVYSFGDKYSKQLNDIYKEKSKINRLFISTAASWTHDKEIVAPFKYLKDNLVTYLSFSDDKWLKYTIEQIQADINFKKRFINILKDMNTGVTDIYTNIRHKKVSYNELPSDMPDQLKMVLSKGETDQIDIKTFYGDMSIDFAEESRGIRKMFEIGGSLIDILNNGKILVYDELENSLHPTLVLYIIELFQNKEINFNNAQLIFTTHDTNLLDLDIFRRDQIWFAEKNLNTLATDIYSLSNLKNVRKDENIEKGYINGKYGAIPFIGKSLISEWFGGANGKVY